MLKKILSLLFALNLFSVTYSQGLLIKHNGDSIRGDIRLSGKTFTVEGEEKSISSYSADDIMYVKSTRYNGTVFHCNLSLYSDNLDVVEKWDYESGLIRDTVMILKEVFNSPKMKLFQAPDKDRVMHYFVKKPTDSLPTQMIVMYGLEKSSNTSFNRNELIRSWIGQQKRYVDQLRVIMVDCSKVTEADLAMMDYRIHSFKRIIRRYNKCK